MPQEEGGRVSLLARGINLLCYTRWRWRGGGVERINSVRIQNGGVVAAKRVRLWLGKYALYVRMRGAKSGWPRRPAMVKEPVAGPKA